MDKFQNRYRISSARLQNWDYSAMGAYFVTICTKNREHFFGEISDDKMNLNELGHLAQFEWINTLELRPDMNLELGEFVVMPNHFHGIIIIGDNEFNSNKIDNPCRDAMHRVSTTGGFGPQSKNLASIIRGFKSSVTTNARKIGMENFAWQSRFHDHIIRDAASFEKIQYYIANNISKWEEDIFFT